MHNHATQQTITVALDRHDPEQTPFWRTPRALVLGVLIVIAGAYLITQHTAHVLAVAPFLLFLACPLMHLFMHHGHGGHESHGNENEQAIRST